MFKNVSRIITVIALLTLVLAACAPAATATTAPVAPVTQAPVAQPHLLRQPLPPQRLLQLLPQVRLRLQLVDGARCKYRLLPGGTPGGGFEQVVYNGAVQAAKDTGANVHMYGPTGPSKMTTQFQAAAATKPDGIAIMAIPATRPSIP